MPQFSLSQKIQLVKEGFAIRFAKNGATTFAFLAAIPSMSQLIEPMIPKEKYTLLHNGVAISSTGVAVAFLTNPLDVIYKTKILKLNVQTMKTPSYKEVFLAILGEKIGGLYNIGGLYKGFGIAGVNTGLAFIAIETAFRGVDYLFSNASNQKNSPSFFSPAPATIEQKKLDDPSKTKSEGPSAQ